LKGSSGSPLEGQPERVALEKDAPTASPVPGQKRPSP
jgi:hypothetical protein